jgi:ABC-type polysaccharide/polyol phosphate transport system ATPase subunit
VTEPAVATQPVVEVSHLTKRFAHDLRRSLAYGVRDIGRELIGRGAPATLRPGEFAALDDVSFELHPGQALAVVGANGAGKSTLLKILYGLVKPDGGEVRLRGKVGALIELGTGFDPVLSGRENIAVNGSIVGLNADELRAATREIIEFSELGDAIDKPVRHYSSGMAARLAFAVAAHLQTGVLLVDEVLAVGDFAFQRKCVEHMRSHLDRGGVLILVTHNVFLAQTVCDRGLVLDGGRCAFAGTAVEAVSRYLAMSRRQADGQDPTARAVGTASTDPVTIRAVRATGPDGGAPAAGRDLRISVTYECREPADVHWGFSIWTGDHWLCVTGAHDERSRRIEGSGELACRVPRMPLLPGTYALRAFLLDSRTEQPLALYGYGDGRAPELFSVAARADRRVNGQAAQHQLMTVDVVWH